MSAQAVGHNCISIIIPCHRVVGADGSLTGYAGGIEKKIKLLSSLKNKAFAALIAVNALFYWNIPKTLFFLK